MSSINFRRYEKYKPSEIEWIKEIPEEWEVRRVKDLADLRSGNNLTSIELEDDAKFPVYGGNGFRGYYSKYTHNGFYVLIGRQGALCGNINYGKNKFWATDHAVVANHKNFINVFWFGELLKTMNLNQYSLSAAQPGLSVESIKRLKLPFINFKTQTKIANFLDQKTSQTDKKIDLLEQKFSKYEELKKTLINETVCRGLDKNVELKESEVEWIGKIPKHWEVKRVKDVFYIGRGRVIAQTELIENGKYPVYSSQTENEGCLGYINTFDFNTQLLTWTTDGVNAGTVFQRNGKFNCTNICGTLLPKNKKINLNYQKFALQISATNNKRIDTNGAKIMNNEMKVIKIVFPPIQEQTQIANYLDEKCTQIDKIRVTIKKEITLLKEFRKTLINDVVTGKVRIN